MLSGNWQLVKDELAEYEDTGDDTLLTEDMFQATYNDFTIDGGWYGSGDANGVFIAYLIRNADWEEPLIKRTSYTIQDMKWDIQSCAEYVLSLSQ
ncbi:MAG: hypothetical protein JNL13_00480 [Chitinophagaceae bacterium]|nr:hypothetical protein [Chitinophagaceae bacterium]